MRHALMLLQKAQPETLGGVEGVHASVLAFAAFPTAQLLGFQRGAALWSENWKCEKAHQPALSSTSLTALRETRQSWP